MADSRRTYHVTPFEQTAPVGPGRARPTLGATLTERLRGRDLADLSEPTEPVAQVAPVDPVEALAALAHEQWAGWTRWMLDCLASPERDVHVARWERQIATSYTDLTEREKESDRVEARKVLALLTELGERRS